MSIRGLIWPWRTKKGRTVERYDKIGRLRVLCVGGGSPATGVIEIRVDYETVWIDDQIVNRPNGRTSRWTRCPECSHKIGVTGQKSKPRLTVHNAYNLT